MATFIEMPKLSDTMTEGTLLKWHVKEGDSIAIGDALADVETDKATMVMEAFDEGILGKIYVKEGDKADLGSALAVLVEEGEEAPDTPPETAAPEPEESDKEEGGKKKPTRASKASSKSSGPREMVALKTSTGRIKASPLARKIAATKGVDLNYVEGTGPGGRIVSDDVEAAAQNGSAAPAAAASGPKAIRPTMDIDPGAKRLPLTGMRSIIAERLLTSKSTIPHFYLQIEVDAGPLMTLRKQVNESPDAEGNKFTVNDFILKATVLSAVDVPEVNAAYDFDSIIQYKSVNLAVAIAIPEGLVTPVIKGAQDKTLLEISKSVKDLAGRAKNKKLSPDEFAGGTITVSNLGSYGVDFFDAIINPPQASILSIGTVKPQFVPNEEGEPVLQQRMWVGMSCDHRVIDGAIGATYLQAFRKYIENPASMLL